jgi:hypothetical protein
LKEKIYVAPISRGKNWSLPFHIYIDASNIYLGAVLGKNENQLYYAIDFVSKNMTPPELSYIVIEKEFLAVVHAINKFRNYITSYEIFIHTNHLTIRYLMRKPITNDKVTRWLLLLQEFYITILDRHGKENVVAEFLSRIHNEGELIPINDNFHDEHLFIISTKSPWFADIVNYIAT